MLWLNSFGHWEQRELPLARIGTEICARGMHGVKYSYLKAFDVLDR